MVHSGTLILKDIKRQAEGKIYTCCFAAEFVSDFILSSSKRRTWNFPNIL